MAVAAVVAGRRRHRDRAEPRSLTQRHAHSRTHAAANHSEKATAKAQEELFGRFGSNGKLTQPQLQALLEELKGESLEPAEMRYIMHLTDRDHDALVSQKELAPAIAALDALQRDQTTIAESFGKFDADSKGALHRTQLAALLTQLNKGQPVSTEEVDWVMRHADKDHDQAIDLDELDSAVALFYLHVTKQLEQHANAKARNQWFCSSTPERSEFPGALGDDSDKL